MFQTHELNFKNHKKLVVVFQLDSFQKGVQEKFGTYERDHI